MGSSILTESNTCQTMNLSFHQFIILSFHITKCVYSTIVLVSGYNSAFNIFNITENGHAINLVGRHEVPSDLSWLHVEKDKRGNRHVYAIHEDTGHLSRLTMSPDLDEVKLEETFKLPAGGPAHLLMVNKDLHCKLWVGIMV